MCQMPKRLQGAGKFSTNTSCPSNASNRTVYYCVTHDLSSFGDVGPGDGVLENPAAGKDTRDKVEGGFSVVEDDRGERGTKWWWGRRGSVDADRKTSNAYYMHSFK